MSNVHIQQIFYDEHSKSMLDGRFIALDNSDNLRPDWAELWPIRRYLQSNALNSNDLYGFLSPYFQAKTGLDAQAVLSFIEKNNATETDVFVISPYWDLMSIFKNVFEQGNHGHKGLIDLTTAFLERCGQNINLNNMVSHSQNTAFCNYVIAKPHFWQEWLRLADDLFDIAEQQDELASALSKETDYKGHRQHPIKIFIQERLSSFILAKGNFNVVAYNSFNLPAAIPIFQDFKEQLVACDALKLAFDQTGQAIYESAYSSLCARIKEQINQMQVQLPDGQLLSL